MSAHLIHDRFINAENLCRHLRVTDSRQLLSLVGFGVFPVLCSLLTGTSKLDTEERTDKRTNSSADRR